MFFGSDKKRQLPEVKDALPGRKTPMPVENRHYVSGHPIKPPFPGNTQKVVFAMGCFWGAERLFWQQKGVYSTAVGYINGLTPNPVYDEVCTGMTGHTEAVLIVFEPDKTGLKKLLSVFWESHDPTQGMRQGNDRGTQYRSGIYVYSDEQKGIAESSRNEYQARLIKSGFPSVTTEVLFAPEFYYAEQYHQQYLAKNPAGYCGLAGTGVSCPSE
ncbi:MAG: peptide-methionine (S)-S-oxide reductase MsrA [Proteobacteria bacterium]|nr:peptide-methionine (S)-S-oxide reductase MsrA [Pseudomonadota bacterium]NOG60798.1 peptide-methionine (S)-S-oxide reductase MsrA [Pseudomonadota bacterium]